MQMETNDWQAFNLATEALRDIDRFAAAPATSRSALVDARRKLKAASTRDPEFLRAKYYAAIVADMLGKPSEAIAEFTALLGQSPTFTDEARYNLAVSHYHMYVEDHVEAAIEGFGRVAQGSADVALQYMSNAGLVRAYAMMVLHNLRRNPDASLAFERKAVGIGSELLERIKLDASIDQRTRGEIEWRVLNGRGVARMFASDADQPMAAREALLDQAFQDFLEANALSVENWEIVCNLGSSQMRLGVIKRTGGHEMESKRHFDQAQKYLTDVITRIRPRYGFALYELGRTARLRGEYSSALSLFQQALQIPDDERNVDVRTIDREIERARAGTVAFP